VRRKVDIDQIRSALELYRSNDPNGAYPTDSYAGSTDYSNPPYLDQTKIASYLQVPIDPGTKKKYFYRAYQAGGTRQSCGNAPDTCRDYTLATRLETSNVTASCGGISDNKCYLPGGNSTANCNYCVGPLGEK
jgi:hypothetical protein